MDFAINNFTVGDLTIGDRASHDDVTNDRAQSKLFVELARELLVGGNGIRFQARGASMSPAIRDGEIVYVRPAVLGDLRRGDLVLIKVEGRLCLHRLVVADVKRDVFITRGDCGLQDDPAVSGEEVLGVAEAKEVRVGRGMVRARLKGVRGRMARCAARGQRALKRLIGGTRASARAPVTFGLLLVLLAATAVRGQVAVDATTSGSADAAGTGTVAVTVSHTTTATANRLLIVGVSISLTNSTGTTVSSVIYGGSALTRQGFHNDAGLSRRVEMWSLLAPASGTANVVVNVNVPTNATVGVVVGATTFTGVDQTVAMGSFVSADGAVAGCVTSANPASSCNSQLDVPSVVNGMVIDTLATGEAPTVTMSNPQVQQWNVVSGGGNNRDVTGTGSSRTGAPMVPVSELFSSTSNWSQGAISVNPSTADVAVSTSVGSAVFLGSNTVYTITVTNNGPSAANGVTLTDTLAAGPTFVSAVASAGTTCSGTGPVNCTLPTPLASGTTATITVTVTAGAAGAYANTATITDSGTPPDPSTGNNSYTAVATVQTAACATVSQAAPGGTLTGTVNTYYPGTASVAAGATSIPIGTAAGAGNAIAVGNLLLVIQMQDASIDVVNSVAYGNGDTGQGFTALNSAGNYEFVTATSASGGGGSVSVAGSGTGGGLVFAYHASAATATAGQSTYQVIVVPQYTSATLSSGLTASAWNGSTGGVLALDISGTLTLNSAAVAVDGLGFRGGAGMQLQGGVGGNNTDYIHAAPAAYTGAVENGVDAVKGEGIAGTPLWVESGGTYVQTTTGYPSGTAGTDGSSARGAPGNGGGGGTDADQGGNTENAGGGGGGNGGAGGFGGDSWDTNLSVGGEGGTAFPATINRVAMGGGGGAGTRNNSDGDNQASGGATGGGIIIIRANLLTGTATLTANGINSYNGTANDAGGGGGAGGSIVVLSATGGESGLTLNANGGTGGDAWASEAYTLGNRHGPGGGGGGGAVFVSGPASVSVLGAASGTTENPGVTYGSTAGANGTSATNASISSTSGTLSGAQCTPDMTLGKSHVGNFVRGSAASYTIPVSNLSPYGATNASVTINDTLPTGVTPTSATGSGWACAIAAQTISCMRSDVLAGASSYPSITVNANVAQSAPATVTNTALVGGGGEINLANDSATDVATVVSNADLSVTNVGTPDPVAAGSNITYMQVVTNNGPSAADNATLIEPIPANMGLVSVSAPAGWSCITPGATGSLVCTNSDMAGSTSGTFTVVMQVASGTANGTVITETASVSSSASDPNAANNTATVNTVVGTTPKGELTVTNVASPNPVAAGSPITYTQVVTNTGTAAATTATFNETTPANTTFASITPPAGWNCTGFPPQCTNPSVAAGASGTFKVVYNVTAGTANGSTISDTATVNAANQAFGANAATAADVVGAATQADLLLATAATPGTVLSGNDITYTQTVTNNGPAAATTASFTEVTPTNTTFASVSAPVGWTCTTPAVGTTGTVNCTDPSMASGTAADIIVVLNVAPTIAAGTITATSSVTATNVVNTSTTTTATLVTVVCDLTVTSSGTPNPATQGNTITYTQTVYNHGPSNCVTAKFGEANPNNTTFTSVAVVTTGGGTWTCPNTGPVACTNPSVPPGSTATISAVYTVVNPTAAGTIIADTATASSATKDSNTSDNSVTVNIAVAVAGDADLSMANSASPSPVTAGGNITYTQTVKNLGPATAGSNTANTITLTETLPTGTTAVSLAGPTGWTCNVGTLLCKNNANTTLASGASAVFTFVVTVSATVTGNISDTVSVAATTPTDPNPGNNSATATVGVADSANLSITNAASPVPVAASANVTYTQVVTNSGPSAATSVTLTDTLPANTTVSSLTGPGGTWICTAATGTCTDASFAPGTASFTYVVTVNAGTPAGTAINSTATVTSATTDPNLANNSATATDVVAATGQADLSVANAPSVSTTAAGTSVTYTQVITNLGPAATTAATATLTETVPANMNFQSITHPAGWTCTTPAVGGTGTITCTAGAGTSIALNGTASFSLVMQVNATAPSGTNIPDTATASAGNVVPNLTTNNATATVLVANANSADMAIVKTATPNPVSQGETLTYTLAVTNNGPASATTVTVADTLPTAVTYLSVTTTTGTCSEAGGTVTCLLGTMANAGTATITILTIAGTPGVVSNTATVTADQTDPNTANNSSTQTETIAAPTSIQLQAFAARAGTDRNGANRVLLTWKTGGEANNLGFNIYRELNGNRVRLNPSLIAGSALWMSGALPKHSGKSYNWIDPYASSAGSEYWLEDVDVNGTRTMHGPVSVEDAATASSNQSASESASAQALMLNQLNQAQPAASVESHPVENMSTTSVPTTIQIQEQFKLAAHPAVKILVKQEGWYSVAQPDLVKAGLDPNVDPASLQLFAEAIEQPIQITGAAGGPGGFGPQASINFYGTGIETPYSGTRVYWLVAGSRSGQRIQQLQASSGTNQPSASFLYTIELQPRTIYFAALITQDGNNFFGPLVSTTAEEQVMQTPNFNASSTQPATFDVALQGVIQGIPHDVSVALNGTVLGNVTFTGQQLGKFHVSLPPGVLQEGNNTITLTAQNGEYDTSLVSDIRITYPHLYTADSDQLKFTGRTGEEITVGGFTNGTIAVLDITNPAQPVQVTPQIVASAGSANQTYSFTAQVPWTTTAGPSPGRHTLLAVAADRIVVAAGLRVNHPSTWHSPQTGADIAMVSHENFIGSLPPLVMSHKTAGKSSVVVPIGDLYDEFNFGERSPYVIRQFLQTANMNWRIKPKYLLLNGRASVDPRNYLGFGYLDFVPTKIVAATGLMTASDDWYSDFNNTGMPTIPTGRLPVSTLDEANTVVGKIAAYEGQSTNGTWTGQGLVVADENDSINFTQDSQTVQSAMPSSLQVTDVFTSTVGAAAAREQIVSAINSGQLLVNYLGHGAEQQWSGSDIFDDSAVATLTNGSQLPVFFIMDCLNGFFQDVYAQPLAVTLILAPNGGGVAVLASSGLNQAPPQVKLDALVVKSVLSSSQPTLGDAIVAAKSQISDAVVRKTYILFGDPAMRVKPPVAGAPAN